jgi:hypothetical protein
MRNSEARAIMKRVRDNLSRLERSLEQKRATGNPEMTWAKFEKIVQTRRQFFGSSAQMGACSLEFERFMRAPDQHFAEWVRSELEARARSLPPARRTPVATTNRTASEEL